MNKEGKTGMFSWGKGGEVSVPYLLPVQIPDCAIVQNASESTQGQCLIVDLDKISLMKGSVVKASLTTYLFCNLGQISQNSSSVKWE